MAVTINVDNDGTFELLFSPYRLRGLGEDNWGRHTVPQGKDIIYTRLTFGQHEDIACAVSQRHEVLCLVESDNKHKSQCWTTTDTGDPKKKEAQER
jgi:hypothetical protein